MSVPRTPVRLAALDAEDLAILSAFVQDAVAKVGDLSWRPAEQRFVAVLNRFAWEKAVATGKDDERHRAVLHFSRVTSARCCGIDPRRRDAVLDLLAITFEETNPPGGTVTLTFAGGGVIRLEIECIEAGLSDLGAAWAARGRPDHLSA
ncbi:DUF2948 family protein [Segnochrobactraceae bacterium EtOH-i3]